MRLAVFTKNRTNPAYAAARLGAERAAAGTGAQAEHYVPETPDDAEEQAALIDRALATRPDAFVIASINAPCVDAAIRRVAAAGIPLAAFVAPLTAAPALTSVGADDARLARALARYLFRHLQGVGRVLVVSGPEHSPTSVDRMRGFQEAIEQFPAVRVVGQLQGEYARDVARARTAEWLRANSPPDACLVANDVMAIGVLEALDAAGARAQVVGVNAIPEAIAAIGAGRLLATADFNAMQMAYLATDCALRHLRGERVPEHVELPAQIVDGGNYREWDRPYGERTLLTLEQVLAAR